MKDFLSELNIELETKEERKEIDLTIRKIIGKKNTDKCNDVWKEVKIWLNDDIKKHELESDLRKF